jgi:hypothetical protein
MTALAQDKKIDTVEFNVVSKYKPVITEAEKLNSNPSIADTAKVVRKADYNNFVNSQYPTLYTPSPLDALRMKGEPLDKLFHSYFIGGAGNYNTVYGEYYFNCLRSRDWDYGIHLNHISSEATLSGYGNSAYAFNDVNLYGEAFLHNHTLYAQADFDNHIVHDYGWNINNATLTDNASITRQSFNYFGGLFDFKSTYKDSTTIGHDLSASYYNFSDVYNVQENNVDVNLHAFTWYDKQRIDVKAYAQYYGDKSRADTSNTLNLEFNPYFTTNEKHWDARLGVKVDYDATSKVTAYPDFIGRYHVASDVFMIYAGVDGNKTFNSYRNLAAMNPFIQDTLNMKYTYTVLHIFAGVTGALTNDLTYNVSGYESHMKQMPFFVTDTNEILANRFTVVYDNVRIINGHADINYRVMEALKLTLAGDYYNYVPTDQLKAWYHPDLIVSLGGQYTLQKKYVFSALFDYIGNQYAPVNVGGVETSKTINGYPDLNIGFDYRYNHFLTAFVNLNNLANISYQRWLNYPTQGFNAMVGVRLAF